MRATIELKDLRKSFGNKQVLKGVNLQVQTGTTTVILGGSGSGKSVLMKHIIGLLRPDSGEVWVEGENVAALSEREMGRIRAKFGMVFQGAALFDSMTVGENVSFPLREHPFHRKNLRATTGQDLKESDIRAIVQQKLALVGLEGVTDQFPSSLSGGMRKRVGLARAIVLDPRFLLYDEPTTGLDPITTTSVDDMIIAAKEKLGVTSVVISHDVGSAFQIADQVAMIHEGVIVEQGSPAELRKSNHPYVQTFISSWFSR